MESSINKSLMVMKKNKNKKKSPKVCHTCNKSFSSNTRLENHNRKAHQPQQLPSGKMTSFVNKCDQCIKSYKSVKSLKVHKRTAHRKAVQYTCKTCFDKFQSFNLLQLHIKIKHSKKFHCSKCVKSFLHQSKLKRHLVHCKGEKVSHSFQCSKCAKSFLSHSKLKRHLDNCKGEKVSHSFQCSKCAKSFLHQSNLKSHLDHCKGEKVSHSFQCSKCAKSFLHQSNLKRHLDHCKGEKVSHSFQCSKCAKSFLHQCELKRHLDFHAKAEAKAATKKQPTAPAISCFNCSTQFSNRKLLNQHLKIDCVHLPIENVCDKMEEIVIYFDIIFTSALRGCLNKYLFTPKQIIASEKECFDYLEKDIIAMLKSYNKSNILLKWSYSLDALFSRSTSDGDEEFKKAGVTL